MLIDLCRNVAKCPRVVVFLGLKAGAAGFVISKKSRTSIAVRASAFALARSVTSFLKSCPATYVTRSMSFTVVKCANDNNSHVFTSDVVAC